MITNCNDILERGEGISEEDVSYILITAYQALSRLPLASTQHNNSGDQCIEEREKLSEDMLAILERAISLVRAKIESSPEDTHRQKLISYLYECVEYARYWIDYNLALNNLV